MLVLGRSEHYLIPHIFANKLVVFIVEALVGFTSPILKRSIILLILIIIARQHHLFIMYLHQIHLVGMQLFLVHCLQAGRARAWRNHLLVLCWCELILEGYHTVGGRVSPFVFLGVLSMCLAIWYARLRDSNLYLIGANFVLLADHLIESTRVLQPLRSHLLCKKRSRTDWSPGRVIEEPVWLGHRFVGALAARSSNATLDAILRAHRLISIDYLLPVRAERLYSTWSLELDM